MKARIQFSYKLDMSTEEFTAQTEMLGRVVEVTVEAIRRRGDSEGSPSLADFMELAHRVVDRLEPARPPFTMPDPPPPPFGGEDESEGEEPEEGEDDDGEDDDGVTVWTTPKWDT